MAATSISQTADPRLATATPDGNRGGISRNKLLNMLPADEFRTVMEASELVTVKTKQVVFEADEPIPYVYFPEDGVISLVVEMEDGSGVEAMTVGCDGFTALSVFHRAESMRCKGVGQITGRAQRMTSGDFVRIVDACPVLEKLLHRYCQLVFEAVSQSAACNRLHVIEERCARWLLMSQDRVGRPTFDLTQGFLAEMLGVRRPGVTVAMGILEKAGFITHGRGTITIIDRPGLENASCECYRTIKTREAKLIA